MTVEHLDLGNAEDIAAYERAFYAVFQHVRGNLIRRLWRWNDEERRLATRIPYDEQLIYVRRNAGGAITAAMAMNIGKRAFQGNAFGFAPEPGRTNWCEALTYFSTEKALEPRLLISGRWMNGLAKAGFETLYGTTAPHPLKTYLRYGAKLLATTEIEGETRHFIRFDLPQLKWDAQTAIRSRAQSPA